MFLGENMSDIMHKGKHLFNFMEGITRALTSKTIGHDSVLDFIQNLLPKKIWKK